jgi:hypothetical protein
MHEAGQMTVIYNKMHRTYDVVDNDRRIIKAGFATQADAWQWIDGQDDIARQMQDTYRRIQTAFANR